MKRFTLLLKHEYDILFRPLSITIGVMAVLQLFLFILQLRDVGRSAPLALVIDNSAVMWIFAIAYACLLGSIIASFVMNYTPAKSIYALLTLPIKRTHVYWAKLSSALLAGFVLLAAQMALVLLFSLFTSRPDTFTDHSSREIIPLLYRSADLYLSLLTSQSLRILFPPDIVGAVFSVVGYFGTIAMALFVAVQVAAGNKGAAIGVIVSWLALIMLVVQQNLFLTGVNIIALVCMVFTCVLVSKKSANCFTTGRVGR